MSNVWFTSDTHFVHEKVADLRGFASTEQHDEAIASAWNSVVQPQDIVWHLGDVGLGSETAVLTWVACLNGKKHLVTGNHDPVWPGHRDARKHQRKWLAVFESVQAFAKTRIEGETVLLSHFPYSGDHTETDRATQFRLRDEGALLLHGHLHCTEKITSRISVHVGLDAWDLKPVSSRTLATLIRETRQLAMYSALSQYGE
jgi:calcineurin-like phosphoesterase family protein